MKAKKEKLVELGVEFRNVSIGSKIARIGFSVDRDELDIKDADGLFTDSQVRCRIVCDPNSKRDAEGQNTFGVTGEEIDVVADIKGFRVTNDAFTSGLSINKNEADVAILGSFSSCKARLHLERVGAASTDHDGDAQ